MTVDGTDLRCGYIEDTWRQASDRDRRAYLDELHDMSSALESAVGPDAEPARWLTRRVNRVGRLITGHLGESLVAPDASGGARSSQDASHEAR